MSDALNSEIACLQRQIDEICAELERRDVEQIAVEGGIEFLHHQSSRHLWVLGKCVLALFGRGSKWGGDEAMAALYPHRGPGGANCAADVMVYRRPGRRWTQFGSRKELLELAAANGVPLTGRDRCSREGIVRRLWRARVLPGSIAMFDEQIAREERQVASSI